MLVRDGQSRRGLSFSTKLSLSFAGVALAAIAAVLVPTALLAKRQATAELRSKAVLSARLIGPQLRTVVAFDDTLTAREVFAPFAADPDIAGLAIYSASGQVIEGLGNHPERIEKGVVPSAPGPGYLLAVAPVVSKEGPTGTLVVMLSTNSASAKLRDHMMTAAWFAGIALVVAALIAAVIARRVAVRLRGIAAAATRVADGDYERPPVDSGSRDEIGKLVDAFNTMVAKVRQQFAERKQLAETEQARLEEIVVTRTAQLEESREQYRLIAESTNAIPFTYLPETQRFTYVGPQVERCLGFTVSRCTEPGFLRSTLVPGSADAVLSRFESAAAGANLEVECSALAADGTIRELRWVVTVGEARDQKCLRGLMLDITHQRKLESDLQQAQKLESVGRLASGVAHEINTPVQFVSDNIRFLRDAHADLVSVYGKLKAVNESVERGAPAPGLAAEAAAAEAAADMPYLFEEIPKAYGSALEGLKRVAVIVSSMKEFARADMRDMAEVDINRAIQSTLVIAANEYKYVADVETEFGELPPVLCHGGEINQVVLNIVINAAHAIGDIVKDAGGRGRITVRTHVEDPYVVMTISDTGGGIPEHIRARIFDPFFTTKPVGKGSGQGLAIARSVIVDKHGGQLTLETQVGSGSSFRIKLPIRGGLSAEEVAA